MNMKKILAFALCLVLVAGLSIAGTVAYLTAKSTVVENTFIVGNVAISLDESPVDEYGDVVSGARVTANTYKLIPGENYTKDPIVHVDVESERAWLFVKVVNGIAGIEAASVEGGYQNIADQMKANKWEVIDQTNGIYAYKEPVDARTTAVNVPVFGQFTLKGDAAVADYENASITIQAYAVQADNLLTYQAAWAAAPLAAWQTPAETPAE